MRVLKKSMHSKNFADVNDQLTGIGKVLISDQSIQHFVEDLVPLEVHEITCVNGGFGNYSPKLLSFIVQGQVI